MREILIERTRTVVLRLLVGLGMVLILSGCAVYGSPYGSGSGAGTEKVAVCHKNKKTLMLPRSALDAHLGHGDSLGACG